ncbi:hypothetical protein BV22DRAFT_112912 [Leucogyrophana mollusca]|uniref:Uncharacterized protein n=1 Tax=Leucogyrophana mollusca TaxID=85980 RepID=A0ACB8BVP3_9AGAM|nr:hypothetical protein BV22DRAFT_112912 [Leucogyrophana mollusca]
MDLIPCVKFISCICMQARTGGFGRLFSLRKTTRLLPARRCARLFLPRMDARLRTGRSLNYVTIIYNLVDVILTHFRPRARDMSHLLFQRSPRWRGCPAVHVSDSGSGFVKGGTLVLT